MDTQHCCQVVIPAEYDIKRSASSIKKYLVKIDERIDNSNFWQVNLKDVLKMHLSFESLDMYEGRTQIMLYANRLAQYDKTVLNLTLRSVMTLLQLQDPFIETAIGKHIIIPMSWQPDFSSTAKVIVFAAASEKKPRWKMELMLADKLSGAQALLPVLQT